MSKRPIKELISHRKKCVVICGSMTFYGAMLEIRDELDKSGVRTMIPAPENHLINTQNNDQFEEFKRKVSFSHMRRVRHRQTFGILVVNLDKHSVCNYVGPNTFVEIGMAAAFGKKIYLLGGYPLSCIDELRSWGAVALDGDLETLIADYQRLTPETAQPTLF